MAIKQWFKWKPKKIDEHTYAHPNTISSNIPKGIKITESSIYKEVGGIADRVYLGYWEVDEANITEEHAKQLVAKHETFLEHTDPTEALRFANEDSTVEKIKVVDEKGELLREAPAFALDKDNFSLKDLREVDSDGSVKPIVKKTSVETK